MEKECFHRQVITKKRMFQGQITPIYPKAISRLTAPSSKTSLTLVSKEARTLEEQHQRPIYRFQNFQATFILARSLMTTRQSLVKKLGQNKS